MKKLCLTVAAAIISVMLFSGCTAEKFERILPPERDFPQAEEYEMTQALKGDIIVKRNLYGNKRGNTLYLLSGNDYGFKLGDKGTVKYTYMNKEYVSEGELLSMPQNDMGAFIVYHGAVDINFDGIPGVFSVTVAEYYGCITISKNAVTVLDDDGSALVKKVDERGLLYDKEIKVGARDNGYYQVLSGLEEGESVVVLR